MGGGLSTVFPCFAPPNRTAEPDLHAHNHDLIFAASEPLDETLGHSFVYVRSSARFLSPTHSDRFVSPSQSLRFSPSHESAGIGAGNGVRVRQGMPETGFRTISGASVSANSYTPRTVLPLDDGGGDGTAGERASVVSGFESSASFSALPLQPVPRGCGGEASGPLERSGFFLSGPIERGALSGPLDAGPAAAVGADSSGRVHFSAPLGGLYVKKRRKKGIPGNWKAFYRNFSEKKRPWVVPVRNFVGRKEGSCLGEDSEAKNEGSDVQWALGKAGEDRVHVVVSEEQGWLFVGIYDGFNGPDAPEFLMGNLYRAVHNELQGLFWELDEAEEIMEPENVLAEENVVAVEEVGQSEAASTERRVTFQSEDGVEKPPETRRRRLRDFLMEEDENDGLDLSGSQRFAFSVDDALSVSNGGSAASRRWLLLTKLKQGLSKHREGRGLFPWRFRLEDKQKVEVEAENRVEEEEEEEERPNQSGRRRKEGPVDHERVLSALSRALEVTELGYLEMTDKVLDTNPELALMGSCLLVVLMRDEDVYVMNVGDSRAVVARCEPEEVGSSVGSREQGENGSAVEGIVEESLAGGERAMKLENEAPQSFRLTALQLSTDHSTSIEEEIIRIKNEHPDDKHCIVNDRVKGRLKVTRAFGAGFLKQPKWNDAVLEVFRHEYVGTEPYVSCSPSLHHHKICHRDQFLVLSSDGLYQYLTNEEVVTHVENFMEKFPDGDPAQHLIEELLFRAAKKAGMDFHDLLDIPQGDRRKYHDDVTVMIISLEGRIWKSSGKYL